jgi:hypothetical protein
MAAWLEQAWMQRYLERELSSEETAWFESYVLDKADLLAMIDADTGLRDALALGPPVPAADDTNDENVEKGLPSIGGQQAHANSDLVSTRRPRRNLVRMAMAATLVFGLGAGWVGTRIVHFAQPEPDFIANPMRIIYDTMRGGEVPSSRVEHKDSTSPYVLVEVAVPPGAQDISVKIGDAPGQVLTPSPDGFVSFLIQRELIGRSATAQLRFKANGALSSRVLTISHSSGE